MKKAELEKRISQLAKQHNVKWEFVRQGGNHEVWNFNNKIIPIPRHREIVEKLAKKILKDCENTL